MGKSIIDRAWVKKIFNEYTSTFDINHKKICVKVDHTFRVAQNSDILCDSLDIIGDIKDLCWLIAIVHDIGRFKQIKVYNTFMDFESANHAELGIAELFDNGLLRKFLKDDIFDELIYKAVFYHNVYSLPINLKEREWLCCNIIRDADKIDILRVVANTPMQDLYNEKANLSLLDVVSKNVYKTSMSHKPVQHSDIKNGLDAIVADVSIVYDLFYLASYEVVQKQDYVSRILSFDSGNEIVRKQFHDIGHEIHMFLDSKVV